MMCSMPEKGIPFVCSWSGGKDSCLALYRAVAAGAEPKVLLSMLREDGTRSRSHGLQREVLQAQADSLGVPLVTKTASWPDYESVFIAALQELKAVGVAAGVFGDIDIDEHQLWEEQVCAAAGIEAYLPLWKTSRLALLGEFLMLGFEATIVTINGEKLD
jgi:diphthine-ammonia ligase